MAKVIRGPRDSAVEALAAALGEYEERFPGAHASLYRVNPGAVCLRIIDTRFAGRPRSRRHDTVWRFLSERVSDDVMGEVSTLLLLAPAELKSSLANMDFEDPVTSPP